MRIIKLTAQNVKRLSAVEIRPDGNVVELRGKNGAGKSSVLDAIWMALGGKGASPEQPIRQGETEAVAVVELDNLVVRRTWTKKDTYLHVTAKEGHTKPPGGPQQILDELVGKLTFDPLEFARMNAGDRRHALLGLLGIGETLAKLGQQESDEYERRRVAMKQANEQAAAANATDVPADTPDEPVSVVDLSDEMRAAMVAKHAKDSERSALEEKRRAHQRKGESAEYCRNEIARLKQELGRLQEVLMGDDRDVHELANQITADDAHVAKLEDPDVGAIQQRIATAEATNASVSRLRQRRAHEQEAKAWREAAAGHDAAVERARDERRRLLRDAKWPVEGLGIEADTVLFNGVPFDQCADSEKLRMSLAIAMAANPKLKVLCVRDGSLLDDNSLRLLYDEVRSHDYQLWIERVGENGDVGIVIEDGHIKAQARRTVILPA